MSALRERLQAGGAGSRPYITSVMGGGAAERWRVALVHPGWISVAAAVLLSLLGVYAIDVGLNPEPHAAMDLADRALKQLFFLGLGVLVGLTVALPHYRLIGLLAWPSMILSLGLLVFLLIPVVPEWLVKPENGARAWINLKFFKLQPSELAKISFVLVVAQYLRFRRTHRRFFGLVPVALIAGAPLGLIMLQPDLGTVLLFIPSLFAMLAAAGARLRHLVIIVAAAGLAAPAVYPFLMPHQKTRIKALVSQIQGDRQGALSTNYQSFTAQTLAGAGRIAGNTDPHARALVRYNRLPERHNDMIFSVIVARFGLLGGLGVLGVYMVWIVGALLTAGVCKDPFGRLVAVGLSGFIAAQVVVNVGMNIGLLPIIGITLPFLSYGGSSMLTVWIMTGLLVNIAMRKPVPPFRPSFEYDDDE